MFKKLFIGLLIILLVGVFSATTMAANNKGEVKITYWAWAEHIDVAKALKEEFQAEHPNINIELVSLGAWDLHDKVLTSLVSGVGAPDVTMLVTRRFSAYMGTGGFLDLTEKATKYKDKMDQFTWNSVTSNGKVLGMPYDRHPAFMFYRKDLFDKYNIKAPLESWEDVIEAGKKLNKVGGPAITWQMYPGGQWGASHFIMHFQARGGNFYETDGNVIRNNEVAKEMLQCWYDIAFKHKISLIMDHHSPDFYSAIRNDKLAAFPAPLWFLPRLKENAPDLAGKWRVMPFPKYKENQAITGIWGGNVLAIPKQTKHPEEAWMWVEFLSTTKQAQTTAYEIGGSIPAYLPAMEEPALDKPIDYLGGQSLLPVIKARDISQINYFDWARTEETVGYAIESVFSGKKTVEEAWKEAENSLAR